jgi:predicted MPP superfamily phosphohydrolase
MSDTASAITNPPNHNLWRFSGNWAFDFATGVECSVTVSAVMLSGQRRFPRRIRAQRIAQLPGNAQHSFLGARELCGRKIVDGRSRSERSSDASYEPRHVGGMGNYTIRILHVSDLHERGPRETSAWRKRRVLGTNWKKNVDVIRGDGPVDLVCFTGDIANWGLADEYEAATSFVDELLGQLELGRDRLFVVPGNHDIDRKARESTWKDLRKKLPSVDSQHVSRWMCGESGPPLGLRNTRRDEILERQAHFREWLRLLGRSELLPEKSPHGRLGYRATIRLKDQPFDTHVLGLDSAWLAGDDHDSGKLRLTEDQVMRLATERGEPLPGFRLALMHHPLSDLADGGVCQRLLAEHVDLVLRGHLHDPQCDTWADPERTLRQFAAGCLYEGTAADKYPNSCHLVEIHLTTEGLPFRYDVWFRGWADRGHWFNDDRLYRESKRGRLTLWSRSESPEPLELPIEGGWAAAATPSEKAKPTQSPKGPVMTTAVRELGPDVRETLYSTLFPVMRMPKYVFGVPTDFTDQQEFEARKKVLPPKSRGEMCPFIIRSGMLFCFHDLRDSEGPFRDLVGRERISRWSSREWWDNENRFKWYVQLFNRTLNKLTGRRGLNLDKDHHRYFFEPEEPGKPLEVSYRPLNRPKTKRYVVWRPVSKKTSLPKPYWIHLAVGLRFIRITPEDWCLSMRPELHLTKDGRELYYRDQVGSQVTRKKSKIYNFDLLEDVNFWRDYLGERERQIILSFGRRQGLVISTSLLEGPVEWPGIPEEFRKSFANIEYEDTLFGAQELASLDEESEESEEGEDEDFDEESDEYD